MILIKADHERRVEIAGLAEPARRPVDIDQAKTGFANLRTLRIYQFDAGSVIDGHAEEDEVFIVLLAGSIELSMSSEHWQENDRVFALSVAVGDACAAYLPPHAAYELTARKESDVAYARATPAGSRPPKVFVSQTRPEADGVSVRLEELHYAERLRLRLLQVDAQKAGVRVALIPEAEARHEGLVYVRGLPAEAVASIASAEGSTALLNSWDAVAVGWDERPILQVAAGSSVLALLITAV